LAGMTGVPIFGLNCQKSRSANVKQDGHFSGKVREWKSGQGKVRENRKSQLFSCREYCSDRNMQQWSSLFHKVVHQMLSERRNCISYMLMCVIYN